MKKKSLILIAVLFVCGLVWALLPLIQKPLWPSQSQTWVQWPAGVGGNDHYYALTPKAADWLTAEQTAESWGGTLTTITSSAEQDFINSAFLTENFEDLPLWIGLYDPDYSGKQSLHKLLVKFGLRNRFQWISGQKLGYTDWKRGEPNNTPPGEFFVAMNWEYATGRSGAAKGNWNDTPLNGTGNYGGNSTGPYFGVVERVTDPRLPLPRGNFRLRLASVAILLTLALAILYRENITKPSKHSVAR